MCVSVRIQVLVQRDKTKMAKPTAFFILFSLLTLSFFATLSVSDIDTFVYGGCTQQKYTSDSPYQSNVNSLLTSLVNSATYSAYNNFTIIGSSPQDVVYGLYQCRGELSMPDCAACVARSVSQVGNLCSHTCGGSLQLEGCYVKYDNASFLGVEDKTVVLKKCGPSIGYNEDTMKGRDAVLNGLVGSSGPYRVGGSENIQGMTQCTGDLSYGECQDCVSEAIKRLQSECGSADYGDMFLAKCYARYSTTGSHDFSKGHSGKSNHHGEKTFAIIIGLLAGVAILIIFLAFIGRICQGQGK